MFAHAWVLSLLALPILLASWEWRRRGHPVVLPMDHVLGAERGAGAWLGRMVRAANLLPALLLALAIVLLAKPQRLGVPEQERALTNIELCLDVSGSMTSPFGGEGSRYDAAMAAIAGFTARRAGDAFGLTIFGDEVLRWTPLTQDGAAIRQATPWLRPDHLPQQFGGTEIAKGLRACLRTLKSQGDDGCDRMIILLSDGQSSDLGGTAAQDLSHDLKAAGVIVFMVYIGDGGPQPEVYTIANATGGKVFPAGDPIGLEQCFRHIDAMRPAKLKPKSPRPVDDRWPWAAAGLALIGLRSLTMLGLRFTPW